TMRWEADSPLRFSRPIRWLLALHGDNVMPLELNNLKSSDITYGHSLYGAPALRVKNAQDFLKALKKNKIMYDFNERKALIEKQLIKRSWHKNYQLLDEVSGLLEYPDFLEGNFMNKYLKLPKEVFIASMSKNQRIFPLEDKQGNLTNKFLAVLNGVIKNKKRTALHYQNVLDAKLKDALFFYDEDSKTAISKKAVLLKDMVFHKKLGSYQDKVERLKKLSSYFKEVFALTDKEYDDLLKAISLCKADLLTQMVGEFPSLQGVMGKYYAKAEGLDIEICEAIEEHYKPRFAEDSLPKTKLGACLAIMDKFDSVICHFKAGNQPKTGGDMYALRRQAIGIINIILDKNIHLSLSDVYDKVFDIAPCTADKNVLKKELMEFLKERLIGMIEAQYKPRHDLTDAVVASGFDDIYNFSLRLRALSNIIDENYFECARCVVERTNNITKSISNFKDNIDASLFEMQEERALFESYKNIKDKVSVLIKEKDFKAVTKIYGEALFTITNTFFDKVMVNVENQNLRNNRLKLLRDINQLYTKDIADLAKMERRTIE
ncbi:MAG: glycine--tRNA ligase subunit beta, partial [Candidatus Omnitrophica bacterium]|nr:glycine--tRNA ligase subunit beta [Candidatus Omnitrophota bacterium]